MPERAFELVLLERAATSTSWPTTPDLRARVTAAIAASSPRGAQPPPAVKPRPAIQTWRAGIALAVLAGVIAMLGLLAVPTSRGAIADFFGIEGSKVEFLPTPAPGTTATPLPTPADIATNAERVTLAEAAEALGSAPRLPGNAEPDAALLVRYAGQPVVILRYDDFDLWQTRMIAGSSFGKEPAPGGQVEEFLLSDGSPARWVTGAPHFVFYELPDGTRFASSERLVEQSTLIWNRDGVFYRLETDLLLDEAVTIAESLE
jgi:hypothetical protein